MNEPSSETETGCISEVDHGLREGVGEAIHMGLLLGVPAQRVGERWHRDEHKLINLIKMYIFL